MTFSVKPFKIDKARFCSDKCRREWYSNVWSQTDEWKEKSAIRATRMLEDDLFNKRITGIQKIINSLLNDLNIYNKTEKAFGKFTVDNYLLDSGLMIENMGTFYHCDHRVYSQIIYERHVNRIRMDKSKHSFLKNKYNVEVLYLWEEEINNNILLCKQLIKLYIKNQGKLNNYHSFNYSLDNNIIKLNKNILLPYMDWDIKDLNQIIDISTKQKMSRKQLDKWITFNCELCGKEKEELLSHYNRHNHHFCSRECSSLFRKIS
jgi:very-short-patch-repair endonuclease